MTRRKIFLHGMRWVDDDVQSKIDPNQRFDIQSKNNNTNQTPKKENKKDYLTKDRKIKLDKMIKGNGFREI